MTILFPVLGCEAVSSSAIAMQQRLPDPVSIDPGREDSARAVGVIMEVKRMAAHTDTTHGTSVRILTPSTPTRAKAGTGNVFPSLTPVNPPGV